jgi:hypothetical protein
MAISPRAPILESHDRVIECDDLEEGLPSWNRHKVQLENRVEKLEGVYLFTDRPGYKRFSTLTESALRTWRRQSTGYASNLKPK